MSDYLNMHPCSNSVWLRAWCTIVIVTCWTLCLRIPSLRGTHTSCPMSSISAWLNCPSIPRTRLIIFNVGGGLFIRGDRTLCTTPLCIANELTLCRPVGEVCEFGNKTGGDSKKLKKLQPTNKTSGNVLVCFQVWRVQQCAQTPAYHVLVR